MPSFSNEAGDLACATALTSISLVGKSWLTASVFICRLTVPPSRRKANFCRASFFLPCPTGASGQMVRTGGDSLKTYASHYLRLNEKKKVSVCRSNRNQMYRGSYPFFSTLRLPMQMGHGV